MSDVVDLNCCKESVKCFLQGDHNFLRWHLDRNSSLQIVFALDSLSSREGRLLIGLLQVQGGRAFGGRVSRVGYSVIKSLDTEIPKKMTANQSTKYSAQEANIGIAKLLPCPMWKILDTCYFSLHHNIIS